MEFYKFSVIIPVYNAKKYLNKCLNSVVNQTYRNFEVIVINDGSTDGSKKIINKYSNKYDNFIVIDKENEGVAKARIDGIIKADGDYITFLDADDWYEPNLFERLNEELNKEKYSLVQFGYRRSRYGIVRESIAREKVIDFGKDNLNNYILGYGIITYALWNKAYRSDLLKEVIVKNIEKIVFLNVGEDAYLNLITLNSNRIKRVSVIPDCLYNYRIGSGITSTRNQIRYFTETMKFKMQLYEFVKSEIKDSEVVRKILINVAFITKYYSYVFTEKCKSDEEKEKIISELVFENPTIKEIRAYLKETETDVIECEALKRDVKAYCDYLNEHEDEYKKSITPYQKIKIIIPFI